MTSASGTHIQDSFITEKMRQAFFAAFGLECRCLSHGPQQRILFTTLGETLFTRNAYICITFIGLALGGFEGASCLTVIPTICQKIFLFCSWYWARMAY